MFIIISVIKVYVCYCKLYKALINLTDLNKSQLSYEIRHNFISLNFIKFLVKKKTTEDVSVLDVLTSKKRLYTKSSCLAFIVGIQHSIHLGKHLCGNAFYHR